MISPVPARHPSIRWGLNWIFLSLRLTMRTSPLRSVTTELAMARLRSDHTPSAGFNSGAYDSIRKICNQSACSSANALSSLARWTLRLSQHHTSGAFSCWCAVMIRSRYSCQANVFGSPLRPW